MADEIINRVANSVIETINLEDYYTNGQREVIDIKDWLFHELILKEKDFREDVKTYDWSSFTDKYVAISCSNDAIVPQWAYILLSVALKPFAKRVIYGNLETLETVLYEESLSKIDFSVYDGKPVIIKGCSNKPVPLNAYINLSNALQPYARSIMYGEACSAVPLFKKL